MAGRAHTLVCPKVAPPSAFRLRRSGSRRHGFGSDPRSGLQGDSESTSQTLRAARELGGTVHAQTVTAFTDAIAVGFRVVAAIVLMSAIVVAAGIRNTHDQ